MREEQTTLNLKTYLGVAVPFILANVTQPLLGVVDTSVLGKLSSSIYMAGAAIGIAAFNTLYWLFGFFRMMVTMSCVEEIEKENEKCQVKVLILILLVALVQGVIVIACQKPIWMLICQIVKPQVLVRAQAWIYCSVLVWGVPFVLMGYVMLGWLMGRGKVKTVIVIQVISNVMNMTLDLVFVRRGGMGVQGVAVATLGAQILSFALSSLCIFKEVRSMKNYISSTSNWNLREVIAKWRLNWDIMVRTLCIMIVHNTLIIIGSHLGTDILAANIVLIQIECFMAYMYEGLANTARFFTRKIKEQEGQKALKEIQRITLSSSMYLGLALVIIYTSFRMPIMNFFTNIEGVRQNIKCYDGWLLVFPIIAGWGLSAYGLYFGRRYTVPIRKTNILALALFIITLSIMVPIWKNHGLWFAFVMFYAGRSIFLLGYEGELYTANEEEGITEEEKRGCEKEGLSSTGRR